MKEEICGVCIKGFVRVKAKMYTFMTGDNHKCKKAKGINKNAVDDERNYEDYKNVWFI